MELLDQIRQKQDALMRERGRLAERLSRLDQEYNELDIALRVIERMSAPSEHSVADAEGEKGPRKRDVILNVLRDLFPESGDASVIKQYAKELYDEEINPNTLTVSLGRLRKEGRVRLEGTRNWFYVAGSTEPTAQTEAVTEAEVDDPANSASIFD